MDITSPMMQVWEIEQRIPAWAIAEFPTLHFCPDWDFMLISTEHGPEEMLACLCDMKKLNRGWADNSEFAKPPEKALKND